jgi:hypothetical protein
LSAVIDHELRAEEDPPNLGQALTPSQVRSQPSTTCAGALIAEVTGMCRIEQFGRTCTIYPGDWCLIDGRQPFECKTLEERNECLVLRLEGPFELQKLLLLRQSASRRCSSRLGVSRILIRLITEAADQTDLLQPCRRTRLRRAIVQMIWDAAREQAIMHLTIPSQRTFPELSSCGRRGRAEGAEKEGVNERLFAAGLNFVAQIRGSRQVCAVFIQTPLRFGSME